MSDDTKETAILSTALLAGCVALAVIITQACAAQSKRCQDTLQSPHVPETVKQQIVMKGCAHF